MNAAQHMTSLKAGGSPAAQLLAALAGMGQGQGASATGASTGQGGAFAALVQAMASQAGTSPQSQQAGTTGQGTSPSALVVAAMSDSATGGTTVSAENLGAILSSYKASLKQAASEGAAGEQNPLVALAGMLQEAGIDLSNLSLPDGIRNQLQGLQPGGASENGSNPSEDESLENVVAALLGIMQLAEASVSQAATGTNHKAMGQTGFDGDLAAMTNQAGASGGTAKSGNADLKAEAAKLLASLSPEERAQLADALRQLQSAAPTTPLKTEGQTPALNAGAIPQSPQGTTDTTGTTQAAQAAQAGATHQIQAEGQAKAQPQTQASAQQQQAQAQPQAQPQTGGDAESGAQQGQTAQAQAQSRAAAQPQGAAQADMAARTVGQHLPEHVAREATVQVNPRDRATGRTGAPHLLSAGTAASVMAAGQSGTPTDAAAAAMQAQQQAGATASQGTQAAKTAGANVGDGLFVTMPPLDQSMDADMTDMDSLADGLEAASRPGSLEQLDGSVVRLARAPMTHQAAPSQVATHLSKAAEQGSNRFVIQLNPSSLGEVDVELNVGKDGSVHAMMRVEKPETLQMLQRDSGMLQQALQDAGLKPDSGSLSFSLKQDSGQFAGQDGGSQSHGGAPFGETETSVADLAAQPAQRSHAGQLDVTI